MTNSNPPPPPTTLLWAHEIRRENIHLVNELDTTKATLATTTTTLNTLQQTVSSLEATVQTLTAPAPKATTGTGTGSESASEVNANDELETRITELEGGINARVGEVVKRVEGVEREGRRGEKRDWDSLLKVREEVGRCVEERWGRMMGDVRDVVRGEMEGLVSRDGVQGQREKPNPEPELVPDSMPTGQASPSPLKNEHERTISQSTLGTTATWSTSRDSGNQQPGIDADTDNKHAESKSQNQNCDSSAEGYGYDTIKQDGRGLLEYFTFAEATRSQLPPRKREGGFVEVFVGGLDDMEMKGYLEKRLDEDGWAWNALGVLVQGIVKGLDTSNGGQKRTRVEDGKEVKRKTKKRRYIPIVPVDEDDFV